MAAATPPITAADLAGITGRTASQELEVHASALSAAMISTGITTTPRIAAFVANVVQETDRLRTLEEYGDEAYFRSFLGTEWRYHGRGYLMNTWKAAYAALSAVLGVDLVKNPDLLKQPASAARAATWFWTQHALNDPADRGEFRAVAGVINAGSPTAKTINGYPERLAFYQRALEVLKERTTPVAQSKRIAFAGSGWYAETYPTHHDWRPDVGALVLKYERMYPGIYLNTYYCHPPVYDRVWEFRSYDVWDKKGRGYALDPDLGDQVFATIFDDPQLPNIAWIIYKGRMWTPGGGWETYDPPEDGSDPGHYRHIHVTYF